MASVHSQLRTAPVVGSSSAAQSQDSRRREMCLAQMTFNSMYSPVLDKICSEQSAATEKDAVRRLKMVLRHVDSQRPAFLYELLKLLLAKSDCENVQLDKLQESYLRAQMTAPVDELMLPPSAEGDCFDQLSTRATNLRKVLSRVPDEMSDRRRFLETIKEIAGSIKKLLDATNAVHAAVPPSVQPSVERRKKEFVHYSKRFSNTLKDYFKGEQAEQVFIAANQLIHQTALIVRTVRDKTAALHHQVPHKPDAHT